ncbi:MAG: hypothetical protein DMG72_23620 [Acidobacteria bacterium]|nr:MAG: hypothetical protein DMG72_23620 [Acidobacteriota bacterium]
MMPVPATLPQHWGRKGFPYEAKDRVQDQKRNYHPNDDYTFVPLHLFTLGTRLEAASHTLGKMLSSVMFNPQDGHILCDPKPGICGCFSPIKLADALKFLNERATKVSSVQKRGQNGRETGSIDEPSFLSVAQGPSRKA